MQILLPFRGAFLCFYVSLLFAATFCHGDETTVEVVGVGECANCAESNIKGSLASSGLRITIDCKPENGRFKTRGVGELDADGKFKVSLPHDIAKDGKLKEECYAQLHSAAATPCAAHNGLESSKIIFKSKSDRKQTFGLAGKLKFSPVTCTSAFLWPYYKYPPLPIMKPWPKWQHPPLTKYYGHPLPHKVLPPFPPVTYPPKKLPPKPLPPIFKKPYPPIFKKPLHPPPVPIYKPKPPIFKKPPIPKILPPPVPIYKPIPPVYYTHPPIPKVLPPPVPIYKPIPPVHYTHPPIPKVLPPPVPIYKPIPPVYHTHPPIPKVLPPPVPIYKPIPPVYYTHPPIPKVLPPPVPIYKPIPPIYHKPLPPLSKIPPFHKKPCPPLPKLPPLTKTTPTYYHHPKFGKWPPLPPYSPIH